MLTPDRLMVLRSLQQLAKGEKLFRPSGISRVIACPGSVMLALRTPKTKRSTEAARQGTAAHLIGEQGLKGERQPEEWSDRYVKLEDGGVDIHVDEEMVDGTQMYVDEVRKRCVPGTTLFVEQKLSLSTLDPADPLFKENGGTGDAVVINPAESLLTIADLKFGKGIMIKGDSPQLKDYALMAALTFHHLIPGGWKKIETLVVQPRARNESERVKSVIHDPSALLMDFVGELVGAMESALDVNPPLKTGPHCKYCEGAVNCPALRDATQHMSRNEFDNVPVFSALQTMPPIGDAPPALPAPQNLDVGEIATILEREALWDTWMAAVKHYASTLIEGGTSVPGWELGARTGNRRWKEPDDIEAALTKLGVTPEQMYAPAKVRSPAQIEKVLKPLEKAKMAALVDRPPGAPQLRRATGERPAKAPLLGPIIEGESA